MAEFEMRYILHMTACIKWNIFYKEDIKMSYKEMSKMIWTVWKDRKPLDEYFGVSAYCRWQDLGSVCNGLVLQGLKIKLAEELVVWKATVASILPAHGIYPGST